MDIKLNPGDILCPNCNGKTYTGFICIECYGEGKLDWVENMVGKEIPSYLNYQANAISEVIAIVHQGLPIHESMDMVLSYLAKAKEEFHFSSFIVTMNETTKKINVYIQPTQSSTSSSGSGGGTSSSSSPPSHTHSISSYSSDHNHGSISGGKMVVFSGGMIKDVPDHNHSGSSHSHCYRGG